jgi:hypothetical protein
VPSERATDMGLIVCWTFTKQEESDIRKKVELAPESEMIEQDEGVARVVDESIIVELQNGINKSLFKNSFSPTTLSSYLEIGRT